MMRIFAVLLVAMMLRGQDTPPPRISVSGTVMNSATGDGIRKAIVLLRTRDEDKGISYEAECDGNGRFQIDDVEPGKYFISGERQGFMLVSDGATGAPGQSVKVEAGQSVKDVKVKLVPLGVITGRVLDEDGDPVRGAQVRAMAYSYLRGKRQLRNVEGVRANEKGEFRLFGLRPGTFYIEATDPYANMRRMSFYGGGIVGATSSGAAIGLTYFPSASDPVRATPIELSAGAQLHGFDIRMRQEARYSVRGKLPAALKNASEGNAMQQYMLQIVSRAGRNRGYSLHMDDENFEFSDVAPGSYVVVCTPNNGEKGLHARQPVEVVNSDVEGVTLNMVSPLAVSGAVRVEGTPRQPLDGLRVSLATDDPFSGRNSAEVKPDGSFEISDVIPDEYKVEVGTNPSAYVKSIRFGDAEVPDGRIDFTKGSGAVTVILGTDVGEVEGSVKKSNGDAAVRVRVTLIAYGRRLGRHDLSRSGFSDEEGKFHLRDVAPGEYKVFAWEDVPVGAPQDPDFRKPFEKQSADVKMEPSGHQTVELTAISIKA